MANVLSKKFIKVKDCDEYDLIYYSRYYYSDKGRKKRAKQAVNRRFRRKCKQKEFYQ